MSTGKQGGVLLVDLGAEAWGKLLDNVADWLDNVRLAQAAFRQLAEDAVDNFEDPRVKEQIACIRDSAKGHEQKIGELYKLIGRKPKTGSTAGTLMAKLREGMADVLGLSGGAHGPWTDLRQLMLANLNAIGAFGAVEQLGLTLGMPELAKLAFDIVRDKSTEQYVMQEFMLELAPTAILYGQASPTTGQPAKRLTRAEQQAEHAHYPQKEPKGTQPRFPAEGIPPDKIVGNREGGSPKRPESEWQPGRDREQ